MSNLHIQTSGRRDFIRELERMLTKYSFRLTNQRLDSLNITSGRLSITISLETNLHEKGHTSFWRRNGGLTLILKRSSRQNSPSSTPKESRRRSRSGPSGTKK